MDREVVEQQLSPTAHPSEPTPRGRLTSVDAAARMRFLTVRRLFSAVVLAAWLAPGALVAGLALHLAFDHGHIALAAAGSGHPASAALAELVEHGHAHVGDSGEHQHELALSPDTAVHRAQRASTPAATFADEPLSRATGTALAVASPPPSPPPRAAGALLLALLSTLRV
jgi:hypothetical protein